LQRRDVVSAREVEEGLAGFAMCGVGSEERFEFGNEVGKANRWDELACEALIVVRSAAKKDLIPLFAGDLNAHETDIPDVVLRTRMMAASDMEVDGLIEDRKTCVDVSCELDCVGFGIGGGEAAAFVTGAGYGPAKNRG
jgi:hypothetical protein